MGIIDRVSAWKITMLFAAVAVLSGCGRCRNTPSRILDETADWQQFGASLTAAFGTSLNLLATYGPTEGSVVLVRDAVVESVAQDGASMVMKEESRLFGRSPAGARLHVFLKDFSVPADREGCSAVVRGRFFVKTEGDTKELAIEATGVRLSK